MRPVTYLRKAIHIPASGIWKLAFAFLFHSSCTKVIEVNLNNAAKKYVIEGNIIGGTSQCMVQVTQTVNFSDPNMFPPVSGAVVTVKEDNGLPVMLSETGAGIYETNVVTGTPGHTYTLSVSINNQVFTAISQMPKPVNFDSLYVENFYAFGRATKYANVVYKDPPGKGNAYHFIQYKNGKRNRTVFILDDDFSDGKTNTILLVNFENNNDDNNELKSGDNLAVAMECVDTGVYNYWYSLDQGSTGSNNTAIPGNPVSNISGGALGYFSAHTARVRSIIVP